MNKYEKWTFGFASVLGKSHLNHGIPCQDSCFCKLIESEKDWGIAIVSDGAGSSKFSDISSNHVVIEGFQKFSAAILESSWYKTNELPTKEEWDEMTKKVISNIREELFNLSEKEEHKIGDFHATIIVIVFTPIGILSSHIGDGRAGYCDENGCWHNIFQPHKGEYANETLFITSGSENWHKNIDNAIIEKKISAFFLLTDGCENGCYELTVKDEEGNFDIINQPFPPFFNPIVKILNEFFIENSEQDKINEEWKNFLSDGSPFANEPDDKTLVIGIKNSNN